MAVGFPFHVTRIYLLGQSGQAGGVVRSRSDLVMVAVVFKPRLHGKPDIRRGATVEIGTAKRIQASLRDADERETFPVG
jgi:hypothetical protein